MKKRTMGIISIIVFFIILLLVKFNNTLSIDNIIHNMVYNLKTNTLTNIMKIITFFASVKFTVIVSIIILLIGIFKRKILIIDLILLGEELIKIIMKNIIRRPRPPYMKEVIEKSYSFPSGHSMTATLLYGFIIYLVLKSNINKKLKYILTSLLYVLILLIIFSRVYLGVHYFSDCISGLLLSLGYLLIIIDYIERKKII